MFEFDICFFDISKRYCISNEVNFLLVKNIRINNEASQCSKPGTLAMIMVNLAKSWLTMVPSQRSWLIMIYGTLAKIMARSWQDLGKITMVCHGLCQGYHVKNSIEPFSVIAIFSHHAECLFNQGCFLFFI